MGRFEGCINMIVIDNVEISKNPVKTGEAFLIKITAKEVMATWADTQPSKWELLKAKTWDKVKRKIF